MKNTQIKKPITEETQKQYAKFAMWCNEKGYIIKDDNPEYYYCEKYVVPKPTILEQIQALELKQTPRMLRGAALGLEEDIAQLEAIEAEIQLLRSQL
ncbi:hypothetical protein AAIR98_000918 [Elusimicrobium simillimum]|uniref:hypothetical protein n=1 Tax=Elusimicrobium simillimum TaxID=3143438 RepID=UPI003C6F2332